MFARNSVGMNGIRGTADAFTLFRMARSPCNDDLKLEQHLDQATGPVWAPQNPSEGVFEENLVKQHSEKSPVIH
jgi:hypothetical protein